MTPSERPTSVRYGSRYGSVAPAAAQACSLCAAPLPSPRARYCSEACKQRAYRLRQGEHAGPDPTTLTRELRRLQTLRAHMLYECPTCGERYLGVQRCPDCQHFCRALGLGGACPHCAELLLLTDILD
jgi:hypothetical protein